ncbi:MAG: hypothetical protein J1F17_00480 [Oscillospiraceae bacterium]|nr:hypothetical protein [Oscillospiraceae bacterium]
MEEKLRLLLEKARHDENLKQTLLDTRKSSDPMKCFCDTCQSLGYEIYLGELFAFGQDMNDSKLRSVNGGGVSAIDGWDDAYEMFFASLGV